MPRSRTIVEPTDFQIDAVIDHAAPPGDLVSAMADLLLSVVERQDAAVPATPGPIAAPTMSRHWMATDQ